MIKIENRTYDSDSTEQEIELLKSRVTLIDKTIVYYDEVPFMSEFQTEITSKQIAEYVFNNNAKYILLNLVGTTPPNAPQRAKIKQCYSQFVEHIDYVSFYTNNNVLINLVAKFMVRGTGFKKYSIHKTKEQALKAIKNEQNR